MLIKKVQGNLETININQLKNGDVLLYYGTGLISDLIRAFDGSQYSHSAIYFEGSVLESDGKGVNKKAVNESVKDARYVDVYRFKSDNGDEIGNPGYPFQPVNHVITGYEQKGGRYEYESIILLAVLTTVRRIQIPVVTWLIRQIIENGLELINKIKNAGKEPMICSELVYRCFNEAQPDCKYRLQIPGADNPLAFNAIESTEPLLLEDVSAGETVYELDELKAEFKRNYDEAKAAGSDGSTVLEMVSNPCGLAVASYVTPHDLVKSPNLYKAGRLKKD